MTTTITHPASRRTTPREVAVMPAAPVTLADALVDAFAAHLAHEWRRLEVARDVADGYGVALRFCPPAGSPTAEHRLALARPLLLAYAAAHEAGDTPPDTLRTGLLAVGVFVGGMGEAGAFAADLNLTGGRFKHHRAKSAGV